MVHLKKSRMINADLIKSLSWRYTSLLHPEDVSNEVLRNIDILPHLFTASKRRSPRTECHQYFLYIKLRRILFRNRRKWHEAGRKLRNEKLHNLYTSPNIIMLIK